MSSRDSIDINPPSYLAIVAKDYDENKALQSLLKTLKLNYGSNDYIQQFAAYTVSQNTWYSYQYYLNQTNTNLSSTTTTTTTKPPINSSISNYWELLIDSENNPSITSPFLSTSLPESTSNNHEFVYTDCYTDSSVISFLNFTEGTFLSFRPCLIL